MKRARQVEPIDVWPNGDGWTVAVIARTPQELKDLFGLSFARELDDLDEYELAAIHDPDIGQFWLFRHRQSPDPDTEVRVDARVTRARAIAALDRQLHTDRWAQPPFSWLTEHPQNPVTADVQ